MVDLTNFLVSPSMDDLKVLIRAATSELKYVFGCSEQQHYTNHEKLKRHVDQPEYFRRTRLIE